MTPPRLLHSPREVWIGLLCWLSFSITCGAQILPTSEEYLCRSWEVDAGLPNNTVYGIAQTSDGYLWIATAGGLARFDGVRFTTFTRNDTPGLESNYVRVVFAAEDGSLWVGLDRGGVARRYHGQFEIIASQAPRTARTSWTSSFTQDASGAVWFGRAPELEAYRWSKGALKVYTSRDGIRPGGDTFMYREENGPVWFSTKAACGVFDGESFRAIDSAGGDGVRLAPARGGGMWAVRGSQLLRYHADGTREAVADLPPFDQMAGAPGVIANGEAKPVGTEPPALPRSALAPEVTALFEDAAGNLWMGTRGAGLFRFRDAGFMRVPTSGIAVLAIAGDREGNVWVGTSDGGLNRLRPNRFALRQARHGLGRDGVVSMCEDADGRLWLVVQDAGLVRSLDAGKKTFAAPDGWPGGPVSVVCQSPDGSVWIGCDNTTLFHWRNGRFESLKLPESRVSSLLADRKGGLWIATARGGLLHLQDESVRGVPTRDGLEVARALAEDSAGRVWVGTEEGLVFRQSEEDHFERVTLPGAKPGESIRFLGADVGNTMWIGALDGGLYRWRSGETARLPRTPNLPTDDLRSLIIDADQNFWIGTGRGLFRARRSSIEEVIDHRSPWLPAQSYGANEGVRNTNFIFGNRNAALAASDGTRWFATSRGALEIGPEFQGRNAPPLPVLIEEVRVDEAPILPGSGNEGIRFPSHVGTVRIRYALPTGGMPERLQFHYRLRGLSPDWTAAGNEREATFARLPPGQYRFEVEASMDGAEWLPGRAAMAFEVQAAWWETTWFRLTSIVCAAAAFAWLVRRAALYRIKARMQRLERESALERERARIARDMHDELGASLTRIALMSELATIETSSGGTASQRFAEIASTARMVAGALDQIVWTVNPRNDTLERLAGYLGEFAAEYLESAGLALHLELPAELPAVGVASNVRHEILLAVKEALNNAVKYASAGVVMMRVTFADGELRVVIKDDGCGFDPAAVSESANGLRNMRQRLAAAGGSTRIESRTGSGTSVTFSAPIGERMAVRRMCDMTIPGGRRTFRNAHPAAGNPEAS